MKRETDQELTEDRPSRVQILKAKLEISERLLKEYRTENNRLREELRMTRLRSGYNQGMN